VATAPSAVSVRVPAKVNLFLAVRGTRDDGYHELTTVLQTVDLHDEITAELDGTPWACQHPAARKLMRLRFTHDADGSVPSDRDNLVVRAACSVLRSIGVEADDGTLVGRDDPLVDERVPTTSLHLAKSIPVAAGMAGGSADAAATLLALDRLWGVDLDGDELHRLAAGLGADVPFCLHGGTAIATGSGTDTCRVLSHGTFHWVVCTARDGGLSTPAVFAAHDELDRPPTTLEPGTVLQALRTGDAALLASGLHNDLTDAAIALRPTLGDDLEALRGAGALAATVSGSGPTLVGLAGSAAQAHAIADAVGDRFASAEAITSPAGGPRVAPAAAQTA
jgi:4-diphosphocytidyl-2-C-methyl-D-erythritol kinase